MQSVCERGTKWCSSAWRSGTTTAGFVWVTMLLSLYLDESCSLCGGPVAAFFYDSSVTLCCMHLQAIASSGRTHSALTGCLVLREYQQRTNYCQKEKAAGYKTAALKNKQMILLLTRRILISQYQFHLHMPNKRTTNKRVNASFAVPQWLAFEIANSVLKID
jgi:hypothetical protein